VIVRTLAGLQALTSPAPAWQMSGHSAGGLDLYTGSMQTYAAIYKSQPNVRIPVDFLARNVAQLGLPVFRRVSDTDRVRLPDHDLAQWLEHPNPGTTRYRLIEDTLQDYLVYWHAYWLKIRTTPMGLVRLPAGQVSIVGTLLPTAFVWTLENGAQQTFDPSEIVHFGALRGVSPLETLRRILAEEAAAGDYRQSLWGNAGRMEGVIERPPTAPKWTDKQKQSWREQWQAAYSAGGSRPGAVSVLEDGMVFKPISFSAKDAEFLAARKLTREECAAAYHIPLPMVGILDHATYSNVREMRKMLYSDCLGPTLEMIQAEIERQLLPDCRDHDRVYVEFNIAEKLKGSFEEQAQSLSLAVGKPWMKVNEARALQNLPADDDPTSDEIAAQQGGPAAPADSGDPAVPFTPTPKPGTADAGAVAAAIQKTEARIRARTAKLAGFVTASFDTNRDRWVAELAGDLTPLLGQDEAGLVATQTLASLRQRLEVEDLHAA
jgi:HK97 family phage portal protein